MNNLLWFSSPPNSPVKESANPFGNHGVSPVASVDEMGRELLNHVGTQDVKWLCENNGGGEAMSLYIRFDDDAFGYLQFAYSTVGLSPTVQITLRYWASDKEEFATTNSFGGSSLKLSADRCSCAINAQNKFELTGTSPLSTYEVSIFPKSDGNGLSLKFEAFTLPVQIKDGKTTMRPTNAQVPFHVFHRFIPIGTVRGTVHIKSKSKPVSGHATFLHGIQSTRPSLIGNRWDMFQLLDGPSKSALIMLQFKTPVTFAKQAITQSIYVQDGKVICVSTKASARFVTSSIDKVSGYPLPNDLEYKWYGETIEGDPFEATCNITSKNIVAHWDILSTLPFLLRKLLQTFIAKPFTFHWWDKGRVQVDVAGSKREIEGVIFHETTYVNSD